MQEEWNIWNEGSFKHLCELSHSSVSPPPQPTAPGPAGPPGLPAPRVAAEVTTSARARATARLRPTAATSASASTPKRPCATPTRATVGAACEHAARSPARSLLYCFAALLLLFSRLNGENRLWLFEEQTVVLGRTGCDWTASCWAPSASLRRPGNEEEDRKHGTLDEPWCGAPQRRARLSVALGFLHLFSFCGTCWGVRRGASTSHGFGFSEVF